MVDNSFNFPFFNRFNVPPLSAIVKRQLFIPEETNDDAESDEVADDRLMQKEK